MSQPPPYYNQQPQAYHPQQFNPNSAPYPAGQTGGVYYNNQPQPQVIYVDREPPRRQSPCGEGFCCQWLATLMAGICIGELCCDSPIWCCLIPCPCPRFR